MKKVKKIVPRQQPNNAKPGTVPPAQQDLEDQGRNVPGATEGRWVVVECACDVDMTLYGEECEDAYCDGQAILNDIHGCLH